MAQTLSWGEIRQRAVEFAHEWKDIREERAEAQTFWNEFFNVFGVRRRTVASFEEPVKTLRNTYHRIDLFWKGTLLAEHKHAGESLEKAESQAFRYAQDLATSGRQDEMPRYILLSNFHHIALYDLEPDEGQESPVHEAETQVRIEFPLHELHRHVRDFAFFIGQKTHRFSEDDPANLKAAQLMADLHDAVAASKYTGAHLERLLVRLLFCLFADDTGIFETAQFEAFLETHTRDDGSDLGAQLNTLFDVLNTPDGRRADHLDEELTAFPYVNGELFAERLPTAGFSRNMRDRLCAACRFDWSRISPAIFGSLFQGIMDAATRRQIGAHYTSERDILKVIRPLFLDGLRAELEGVKASRSTRRRANLKAFQERLAHLLFLDPACGCGNFLVVTYRELRRLELEVLDLLYDFKQTGKELDLGEVAKLSRVDVDQFYGIEICEWPARIAETALWLTDHQMNTELSLAAGNLFQRIPLRASPHIHCSNAVRVDWNDVLPAAKCSYVLGNPPYAGKKEQDAGQKADHRLIWGSTKGAGILDYVTCWYVKAGEYTKGTEVPCAFVSTNSISQGEQVGILWSRLFSDFGFKIHFAHTTFAWRSEARGAAHVHVVIIGFGSFDVASKKIYVYEDPKGQPTVTPASNINPYLADAPDVLLMKRTRPLSSVPQIRYGSMMIDKDRGGGAEEGLIIDDEERKKLIGECGEIKEFIRQIYGSEEYINGIKRWCLWLVDAPPSLLRSCTSLRKRIEGVRRFRLASGREATRRLAAKPYLFGEIRQPDTEYLLIPKVSSETRRYVPIGFVSPRIIASGSALVLPKARLYHFGVLSSAMHMSWLRYTGGRMKSDYQYSSNIVYNNYPWPVKLTDSHRKKVEQCAQQILDVRQRFLDDGVTLAVLYDPVCTPSDLLKAHRALDSAVDRCYRGASFSTDRERVAHLFQLYEDLTCPLAPRAVSKKRMPAS